jgi:hypothetical protein
MKKISTVAQNRGKSRAQPPSSRDCDQLLSQLSSKRIR